MAIGGFGIFAYGSRRPKGERAFSSLAGVICLIAAIAYFTMGSNLGGVPIAVGYIRAGRLGRDAVARGIARPTRAIYYPRYVDWVITTPLLLLELLLATGLPMSEIFTTLFVDEIMIITGLIGALVSSNTKFAFWSFGMAAQIYIWWILLGVGRESAKRLGHDYYRSYMVSAIILSFLWTFYPLAWLLCEGFNVISADGEMIFYGIIDLLAKPVFCAIHVREMDKLEYSRFGFSSGKYSETSTVAEQAFFTSTGNYVTEKGIVRPHTEEEVSSAGTATAPVELVAHHKVEPDHHNVAAPTTTTNATTGV